MTPPDDATARLAPLQRFATNPVVRPADIRYARAAGAFNAGAAVDHNSGRVVLLVRVYEAETRRSSLALAVSSDGRTVDDILDRPALGRVAPYEEWGVEDARVTFLAEEGRYAITYTGYSPAGPQVCLVTTDDLLAPERYVRHGPRIEGENKNCVVFPERVGGKYVVLHRPMPRIVLATTGTLEERWPNGGPVVLGPVAGTWRSSRVGAGAPPVRTPLGWLFPFHGATTIDEGNVYCMGWCLLDLERPERVVYVSDVPALAPETPYEVEPGPIPQVDMANFRTGVRVVFPQGLVERGDEYLSVYYGAGDVSVGGASVSKSALLASLEAAIRRGEGGVPV